MADGLSSNTIPPASGGRSRIIAFDLARSFAMLLSLSVHCMVQLKASLPKEYLFIDLLFRTSTPTFIMLFGAMIAIVYLPRVEAKGMEVVAGKALARGIQCYLFFLLNVLALMIRGDFGIGYAITCALFLGSTPYASILTYYVILLVLLPWIIVFLRRYGLGAAMTLAIGVHLAYPLIHSLPTPPLVAGAPLLERVSDLIVGVGDQLAGPSVLHSLVLVFAGLWLGSAVRGGSLVNARHGMFTQRNLLILFMAAGILSLFVPGPVNLKGFSSMALRNLNHPAYVFGTGSLALAGTMILLKLARGRSVSAFWLVLSRRSLFAFGFGNVLITLWPITAKDNEGRWVQAGLLLAATLALIYLYDYAVEAGRVRAQQGGRGISVTIYRLGLFLIGLIDKVVDRVLPSLLRWLPVDRTRVGQPA